MSRHATQCDESDQRIALAIEYDGSEYSGWQRQASPELPTIQSSLEKALSQIANHEVTTTCAGRTDAGVHGCCQIVHFDAQVNRGKKAWTQGVNSLLPYSVRVRWAQEVTADFHARFSATARRYFYVIHVNKIPSAILKNKVTHIGYDLNIEAMDIAAGDLLGEQDFSSFRAAGCQSKSANRNITRAKVFQQGPFLILDIEANAFLQHMVRNIVGALLEVGREERETDWISELISLKDRTAAGATAPPHGLYLAGVRYPEEFLLPQSMFLPLFLEAAGRDIK